MGCTGTLLTYNTIENSQLSTTSNQIPRFSSAAMGGPRFLAYQMVPKI